jgi:hypothetical protein
MNKEFMCLIDKIIKYGLEPNFSSVKHLTLLKKNLIELILFYENNEFLLDDVEYPEFDRNNYSFVIKNLEINFPSLKNYKSFLNSSNVFDLEDVIIKNALEDLNEIVLDLLDVKYNFEQNGLYAGTNAFDFLFSAGMEEKILKTILYINRLKYLA